MCVWVTEWKIQGLILGESKVIYRVFVLFSIPRRDNELVRRLTKSAYFNTLCSDQYCVKANWIRTEECSVFVRIKTRIAIYDNTSLNTDEYGALFSPYSMERLNCLKWRHAWLCSSKTSARSGGIVTRGRNVVMCGKETILRSRKTISGVTKTISRGSKTFMRSRKAVILTLRAETFARQKKREIDDKNFREWQFLGQISRKKLSRGDNYSHFRVKKLSRIATYKKKKCDFIMQEIFIFDKKSISMTSIQSSDCKTPPKVIVVDDEW